MGIKKIKPTIISVLGVTIVSLSIVSYFVFDRNLKENSMAMGKTVLVAKQDLKNGCVIKNTRDIDRYFTVKKIQQSNLVKGSIEVPAFKIGNALTKNKEYKLENIAARKLINKKIVKDIPYNQQINISDLSNDTTEFKEDERLFAIPTDFLPSVAGEIVAGDLVDIWFNTSLNKLQPGTSQKVMGPIKVIKIKDGNNVNIGKTKSNPTTNPAIPKAVVIKANEEQIKTLSELIEKGKLFLTKVQK